MWGGRFVRAGSPGPDRADEGVGRGRGRPPHGGFYAPSIFIFRAMRNASSSDCS